MTQTRWCHEFAESFLNWKLSGASWRERELEPYFALPQKPDHHLHLALAWLLLSLLTFIIGLVAFVITYLRHGCAYHCHFSPLSLVWLPLSWLTFVIGVVAFVTTYLFHWHGCLFLRRLRPNRLRFVPRQELSNWTKKEYFKKLIQGIGRLYKINF